MKHWPIFVYMYFLLSLFLFWAPSDAHKFYVSLTDIEYNIESGRLEISSKYFIDDLESALGLEPGQHITLPMDTSLLELMSGYIHSHLIIEPDKAQCEYELLGYELEDDVVWVYLESEEIPVFSSIHVTASQLTEVFDQQKNIVHVSIGEQLQSLFLRKEQVSGILVYE